MKLMMCTCPEKEAEGLAERLLEARVVACVNIINGLTSKYWWKGKIETDKESLLLMKTTPQLVEKVIERIRATNFQEYWIEQEDDELKIRLKK